MGQSVLLIFTAMVGIVGTLGGVWLGRYLERENESRKWRRDRCLEAYSEFLRAAELVRHKCDISYRAKKCDTEEHTKQAELAFLKMAEMNRIARGVSPNAVEASMWGVSSRIGELVTQSITCPKIELSEVDSAKAKVSKLIVDFISAARNDLSVNLPLDTVEGVRKYYGNPWRQRWWRLRRIFIR
jgi:hypothetical protein